MPEYLAPGVYVEEVPFRATPIDGVSTSTAGFVGPTRAEPSGTKPFAIESLTQFERAYGDGAPLAFAGEPSTPNYLWHAVRAFFTEGGKRLYVAPVCTAARGGGRPTPADYEAALSRLAEIAEIALVASPASSAAAGGTPDVTAEINRALISHAESTRDRLALHDCAASQTPQDVVALAGALRSHRAALSYPWIRVDDPMGGTEIALPPSAFVAGILARAEAQHGVHAAAENQAVHARGVERELTKVEQEELHRAGVNYVQSVAGQGIRISATRTLSGDPEWKYVNVRRFVFFIERSLEEGLQWAVFEPNGEVLWAAVRATIENFLFNQWQGGALRGKAPNEAYFVRCDRSTMTEDDLSAGRLVAIVGMAVIKPAEFLILRVVVATGDPRC